jgi:hypothetical protein
MAFTISAGVSRVEELRRQGAGGGHQLRLRVERRGAAGGYKKEGDRV